VSETNSWRDVAARPYDEGMYDQLVNEYYQHSDYHNLGYWPPGTRDPREAGDNLMKALLDLLPEKRGRVLDVACGKGATTRYLRRFWRPEQVTAVTLSEKQLHTARRNAPGVHLVAMDATRLAFRDRSFEAMVCVEAVFHFDTRWSFLQEAHRVLVPGGHLVLSDAFAVSPEVEDSSPQLHAANYVPSLTAYKSRYADVGFLDVQVVDVTDHTVREFCWRARDLVQEAVMSGRLDRAAAEKRLKGLVKLDWAVRSYVFVAARKPAEEAVD
jgi:MPBQ/MSBQ methyltransferase